MKVKSDHRSKVSNLSNWKEEAWKKSGLQRGSNPVEALIFFRLLSNCLNWKMYCDDHFSLTSTTAVQIWITSYILHIKEKSHTKNDKYLSPVSNFDLAMSQAMFSRFAEVLTVAMATSELRACAGGNHVTLASLQPSGSCLILSTSVIFHSRLMFM